MAKYKQLNDRIFKDMMEIRRYGIETEFTDKIKSLIDNKPTNQ